LATASNLAVELFNSLLNVHLSEVSTKIGGFEVKLNTDAMAVEEYKIQEIDPTIKCETTQNSPMNKLNT